MNLDHALTLFNHMQCMSVPMDPNPMSKRFRSQFHVGDWRGRAGLQSPPMSMEMIDQVASFCRTIWYFVYSLLFDIDELMCMLILSNIAPWCDAVKRNATLITHVLLI